MNPIARSLLAWLEEQGAAAWVARVRPDAEGLLAVRGSAFLSEFAAASRRVGKAEITLTDLDRAAFEHTGVIVPPGLTLDEVARIAMLAALPEAEQEATARECFDRGDTRERTAVLRALPLLPDPSRFVALAASSCRTHVLPVFEAICCENPYPASFFTDATFHQMILKALFLDVALDRVVGVGARRTPELHRMVYDYAAERSAAGRSVPSDIDRHFGAGAPAQRSP
jgi:hypothetical protein